MFQLLITVISLALIAALAAATVSYTPWWYKTANTAEAITRTGLRTLEQAYDVATRAANGVPPAVVATESDGGFVSNFLPVLKILPAAPAGFQWTYGEANGLNYFCLQGQRAVDIGVTRGVLRARGLYSDVQAVVSGNCGATDNVSPLPDGESQFALTFYVAFVPGISK